MSNDSTPAKNDAGDTIWRNETAKVHRLDGPAIEYKDGCGAWYVEGWSFGLWSSADEFAETQSHKEWKRACTLYLSGLRGEALSEAMTEEDTEKATGGVVKGVAYVVGERTIPEARQMKTPIVEEPIDTFTPIAWDTGDTISDVGRIADLAVKTVRTKEIQKLHVTFSDGFIMVVSRP